MGLLDGWPFRSREEIERKNREFNDRVIPLGEAQKERVMELLGELKPAGSRNDKKELLFAYLVAKDRYIQKGKGDEGSAAMAAEMKKLRYLSDEEQLIIKTLVKYDSELINIDYYPTADKIRAAINFAK
ncbi:MAG: hypothetical protein LBG82_01360 [Clostridiales Family XIII bacterium]|jgi:hypothetical protein|nr:hypothetical protein [Clostridiales Family XIII bacterium]